VAKKHLTPEQIPAVLFHLSERDQLIIRMFLVLGLRRGEMFALRWNDKEGNSLRIDSSITEGIEVDTKTTATARYGFHPLLKRSLNSGVRSPGTRLQMPSFSLQPAGLPSAPTISFSGFSGKLEKMPASNPSPTRCSGGRARPTWRRSPGVKDVQAHLRHSSAKTTLEHYIRSVPQSVRLAVESLDHLRSSAKIKTGY